MCHIQSSPKFQVDQPHPLSSEYCTLDIKYRLFKVYWKNIYAILMSFDDHGFQSLTKSKIRVQRRPHDLFFRSIRRMGRPHTYWITSKSGGSLAKDYRAFLHPLVDSLVERRLRESKVSDSARFIAGHVMVVDECLQALFKGHFGNVPLSHSPRGKYEWKEKVRRLLVGKPWAMSLCIISSVP